jgi:hypothetical protein
MSIPYALPENTLLGSVYRGDTIVLPEWEALDRFGDIIDLTGATIWFTAKEKLTDPDGEAPGFQISSNSGDISIIDLPEGIYQVTIPASATIALEDSLAMFWDVQVRTTTGIITTIQRGTITFVADVTLSQV